MLSIVTVVWIRIKYTLLDIEFITVITMLNPDNSRSSMTKSTLMVFHLVFGTASGVSSPSSN